MFAKLKKKLEDETQADLGKTLLQASASNVAPPRLRKYNSSQQLQRPKLLSEKDEHSDSSNLRSTSSDISSSTQSLVSENRNAMEKTRSQDDLPGLQIKADYVKRLQAKLQESLNELQESNKRREKIEDDLKEQQAIAGKKLENIESEWNEKYKSLESENKVLLNKLDIARAIQNKYAQKQDDIDELEGFQTQEMAKIKHMLLNCQQDMQQYKTDYESASSELQNAKEEMSVLQNKVEQLQHQLKTVEDDRQTLREQESSNKELIMQIGDLKSNLEKDIQKLQLELQQITTKASNSEMMVNNLRDENDALRHTHDIYCKQTITVIEEKESTVSHLVEKVGLLEQRLNNCSLSDDNLLKAVVVERDNLEKKLEESRQQLRDIKSTWSEKIMALEKQISHLNEKIAEDNEEFTSLENHGKSRQSFLEIELSSKEKELEATISQLEEMKMLLTRKNMDVENQKYLYTKEIADIKGLHASMENDLNTKVGQLEFEKQNLVRDKLASEKTFCSRIENLESDVSNYSATCKELEIAKKKLTAKNEELEAKLNYDSVELEKLTKGLEVSNENVKALNQNLEQLRSSNDEKTLQITSLQDLVSKQECDLFQASQTIEEQDSKCTKLKGSLESLQQESQGEISALKAKISDLELKLSTLIEETSAILQQRGKMEEVQSQNEEMTSQISTLRDNISRIENEIVDKNKVVRLQQQRINDMKKTLQKELKLQSVPFDGMNGELPDREAFLNSFQKENQHNSELMQRLQALDMKDFRSDINFRYLKHVVLKFMTSREYEAQHLIRAISVLLCFSPEEERLIKETLDWKMSWFGSKPEFGKGQMSKTIPAT